MKSFTRIVVSTKSQSEKEFPPSPNFDDEATLLTARPVVPIKKAFDLGVRSYLGAGLIIAAAAIAGAALAVSANYFQNHRRSEEAIAAAPSALTSDGSVSEIPQTPTPTPQSSAALSPKTMAPAAKVVEKRPGQSEQQRHIARVRSSVDSAQHARRQRDAASIREIFEGPSPF